MKRTLLAILAIIGTFVAPLARAQATIQTSSWYDCKGGVSIGVLSPAKPIENIFGTKYTINAQAYTGANVSGIPGAGFMLSGPIDLWKNGGVTLGLAGGWDQGQKLRGKLILSFYSKS